MSRWRLVTLLGLLVTLLLGTPGLLVGASSALAAAAPDYDNYDAGSYVYDASARSSPPHALSAAVQGSPATSTAVSGVSHASTPPFGVAAETGAARSVDEVLSTLPRGNQSSVRIVPDEAAVQTTFADLTRGGTPATWKNYTGQVFEMSDGTQIGLRSTSSSGGSTIDIRIPGQDPFKIHIG